MLMSKRGVKRYIVKLEGATQRCKFWGQIWGQNRVGGMIWGFKTTYIVR